MAAGWATTCPRKGEHNERPGATTQAAREGYIGLCRECQLLRGFNSILQTLHAQESRGRTRKLGAPSSVYESGEQGCAPPDGQSAEQGVGQKHSTQIRKVTIEERVKGSLLCSKIIWDNEKLLSSQSICGSERIHPGVN